MRIQFCGADRTVTGSSHLIEVNGLRILLDLGLYQGHRDEARRVNEWLPEAPGKLDAIVLSHGHLDHCGKLPVATRAGFAGPIYCTPASAEVARVVLEDSAEIQLDDVRHLNERVLAPGATPLQALYTPDDIPRVQKAFRRVNYGQRTDLGRGVSFTLYDAGHILGSAYVVMEWDEAGKRRSLLFTGDVGRYGMPILRDPAPPPGPADYVISESTYGDSTHGPSDQVEPQFLDAIRYIIERKSRMIVPAFAVGRTQTMLWYLEKFIREGSVPRMPIFVDSPMGAELTRVTRTFKDNYDEQTLGLIGERRLFGEDLITLARGREDSKRINREAGPCVIVASSPTCEFGRVLHHLQRSIEEPNDLVVFTSWTPPQTLGRKLQEGNRRVRIYDRWYDVRCQVRTIPGLSAHADAGELMRFLKPALAPHTQAFVVHGEPAQAEGFANWLLAAGVASATVPSMETAVFAGAPHEHGPQPSTATPARIPRGPAE